MQVLYQLSYGPVDALDWTTPGMNPEAVAG